MSNVNTMTDEAVEAVYLFIGELHGYKRGTVEDKLEFGKKCFKDRTLPAAEGDDLHERIWLERLYDELSELNMYKWANGTYEGFHWSVPLELDASASMLGITGALLGDVRLLTMTNMFGDEDVLDDPWHIDGLSRLHVKTASTPRLYGSDQPVHALWRKKKLDFDMPMLNIMNEQFSKGAIGLADAFKDFVVHNCNMKPEMDIQIWNEKFTIKCNHYKRVGDVPVSFELYDTETKSIRKVTHMKTKMVPDLERFRTFTQTLLIHNLDSQACNYVCGKTFDKYGFVLDVHDAYIVSPVAAADVRAWYAEFMDMIYVNRAEILRGYFQSIGITQSAAQAWDTIQSKVIPVTNFKCRTMALK